jgi:hypothetical protein
MLTVTCVRLSSQLILERMGNRSAVFIGSGFNASDRSCLNELGITHIINMAPECSNRFEDGGDAIIYHSPAQLIYDDVDANIVPALEPALEFIDRAPPGAGVLVHCVEGVSRSASIVIALLMRDRALSYDEALGLVRQRRPVVRPNEAFAKQLKQIKWPDLPSTE